MFGMMSPGRTACGVLIHVSMLAGVFGSVPARIVCVADMVQRGADPAARTVHAGHTVAGAAPELRDQAGAALARRRRMRFPPSVCRSRPARAALRPPAPQKSVHAWRHSQHGDEGEQDGRGEADALIIRRPPGSASGPRPLRAAYRRRPDAPRVSPPDCARRRTAAASDSARATMFTVASPQVKPCHPGRTLDRASACGKQAWLARA